MELAKSDFNVDAVIVDPTRKTNSTVIASSERQVASQGELNEREDPDIPCEAEIEDSGWCTSGRKKKSKQKDIARAIVSSERQVVSQGEVNEREDPDIPREAEIEDSGWCTSSRKKKSNQGDIARVSAQNLSRDGYIAPFRVMTLNVQEYSYKQGTASTHILSGIHKLIKTLGPDIVCLQEHVMEAKKGLSQKKLMRALLKDLPYEYTVAKTREWGSCVSPLCNVLMWRTNIFTSARCWSLDLPKGRAAACAELIHFLTKRRLMACSTHLTGGRFEDMEFLKELKLERSVRGEQVRAIASSFRRDVPSIIAGDFNAMLNGYNEGSHFRESAHTYFKSILAAAAEKATQESDTDGVLLAGDVHMFDTQYIGHQTQVHRVLNELNYSMVYKQSDTLEGMKTSLYGGCVDWIYARGLRSKGDEEMIPAIAKELSDHNGVIATLDFL